ncbi:MAG: hypothetical protein RBT37_03075 [Dissulfurispiraceae bacterium]|jgi:hypothetical protein|nr:hypothetical protein [Dissulfurispiraceae bacterium]
MATEDGIKSISAITVSAGTRKGYAFPQSRVNRKRTPAKEEEKGAENLTATLEQNAEEKKEGIDIRV